jgi:hypothetical protein
MSVQCYNFTPRLNRSWLILESAEGKDHMTTGFIRVEAFEAPKLRGNVISSLISNTIGKILIGHTLHLKVALWKWCHIIALCNVQHIILAPGIETFHVAIPLFTLHTAVSVRSSNRTVIITLSTFWLAVSLYKHACHLYPTCNNTLLFDMHSRCGIWSARYYGIYSHRGDYKLILGDNGFSGMIKRWSVESTVSYTRVCTSLKICTKKIGVGSVGVTTAEVFGGKRLTRVMLSGRSVFWVDKKYMSATNFRVFYFIYFSQCWLICKMLLKTGQWY